MDRSDFTAMQVNCPVYLATPMIIAQLQTTQNKHACLLPYLLTQVFFSANANHEAYKM